MVCGNDASSGRAARLGLGYSWRGFLHKSGSSDRPYPSNPMGSQPFVGSFRERGEPVGLPMPV